MDKGLEVGIGRGGPIEACFQLIIDTGGGAKRAAALVPPTSPAYPLEWSRLSGTAAAIPGIHTPTTFGRLSGFGQHGQVRNLGAALLYEGVLT